MTKKQINGKAKGNSFELVVAKALSDWAGVKFERVPCSGGLRWKSDNNVTGDIVPPFALNFPVSIECKKQEVSWDFDRIIEGFSELWDWWEQACIDCERQGSKIPWLIFSKNRRKIYLCIQYGYYLNLESFKAPSLENVSKILVGRGEHSLVILSLPDFLACVPLDLILS